MNLGEPQMAEWLPAEPSPVEMRRVRVRGEIFPMAHPAFARCTCRRTERREERVAARDLHRRGLRRAQEP